MNYTYFGVDTFREQEHPENAVKLTYIGTPDAADPYIGLDRGACPLFAGNSLGNFRARAVSGLAPI